MGYISKNGYARKNEYAAKKMSKQKENTALTDKEHETIEKLCKYRHEMHTCGLSMFNRESSDYSRLNSYFSDLYIKIGKFTLSLDNSHWETDEDYFHEVKFIDDNEQRNEIYGEYTYRYYENIDNFNNRIESFLKNIDDEYGTSYCPTGHTRMY